MLKFSNFIIQSSTDTISLRQLTVERAIDYFKLVDADREHLSQFGDTTADKYKTLDAVTESILHPKNPDKYRFGIYDRDIMVGSNNLTLSKDNSAELGVWVGKQFVGKGYSRKGNFLLLDFAFNILNLNFVFGVVTIGNYASSKSLEKLGFSLTSTNEKDNSWTYTISKEKFNSTI
jgi:RimJ/RimL family protein N-acetyltransferase